MLYDERIVAVLDRRVDYALSFDGDGFLAEVVSVLFWIFEEDLTRPYAHELLQEDNRDEVRFREQRASVIAEAKRFRKEIEEKYPHAGSLEIGSHPRFKRKLDVIDHLLEQESSELEEQDVELSPNEDGTVAGRVTKELARLEERLRGDRDMEDDALGCEIHSLAERQQFFFRARSLRLRTSPGHSLRRLLHIARGLNPLPPGLDDWIPVEPGYDVRTSVVRMMLHCDEEQRKTYESAARLDLRRAYEGLRARLGTALSSASLVTQFKERATWFDSPTLRALAADDSQGGVREDRLTLELARYLHDRGLFPFVRLRISGREPDPMLFGRRRMAVEAKVADEKKVRPAYLRGFWQLHSYMTTIDAERTRVTEGFLVVFRLGGALAHVPETIELERFVIHIVTIDVAKGDTGHREQRLVVIPKSEFLDVARAPREPEENEAQTDR